MGFTLKEGKAATKAASNEPCKTCGGRGFIGDERCPCLLVKQLKRALEPFEEVPLPEKDDKGRYSTLPATGDDAMSKRNVVWEGPWDKIGPQLRYHVTKTLMTELSSIRPYAYSFVTDAEVMEAAFTSGSESRPDLFGATRQLVILRMGYIGFKNAAAPGMILERLRLRRDLRRCSTWIVLDSELPKPFHGWGKDLDTFVTKAGYARVTWD